MCSSMKEKMYLPSLLKQALGRSPKRKDTKAIATAGS